MKYIIVKVFLITLVVLLLEINCNSIAGNIQKNNNKYQMLISSGHNNNLIQYNQNETNRLLSLNKSAKVNIKAFVEPVKKTKKSIYSIKKLETPKETFICREFPCTKDLEFSFSDKPVSIYELPHLMITWNQASSGHVPEISMEADINTKLIENKVERIKGGFNSVLDFLEPKKKFNVKEGKYVAKDNIYLIKRELGFETDGKWRYSNVKGELLLQKRVYLPFNDVQALQVITDSKVAPRIVQFSIDANGNGCRDGYILYEQTQHYHEIINGKNIQTIDLRTAINNLGIDSKRGVLVELILFLPTTIQSYMEEKPDIEIVFLGSEIVQNVKCVVPELLKKDEINLLDFDLMGALQDEHLPDAAINKLKITVKIDETQFIKWKNIFFYNYFDEQVPALIDLPEEALKSWNETKSTTEPLGMVSSFHPLWSQMNKGPTEVKTPQGDVIENKIINSNDISKSTWRSTESRIKGKLFFNSSGNKKNSSILCNLRLKSQGKFENCQFYLPNGIGRLDFKSITQSNIVDIELKNPIFIDKWPFQFTLFDVQSDLISNKFDYRNSEWWFKETELPLSIEGDKIYRKNDDGKIILSPVWEEKRKWNFKLPYAEYIFPMKIVFPGPLPQPCRVQVKIKDQITQIPYGPYSLSLKNIELNPNEFELSLEYLGNKPILWFDVPRIKVIGLKQTPMNELNKLRIFFDNKEKPLAFTHLPDPKGEWINIGQEQLGKGVHNIRILNNDYFQIRTLDLETDTPILWGEKQREFAEDISSWQESHSITKKLFTILLICVTLYISRRTMPVIVRMFKSFFVLYNKFSDKTMMVFWIIAAIWFYRFGMLSVGNQGDNIYFTIGGITLIVVLFHFSRIIEYHINKKIPSIAFYMYQSTGAIYFIWAIIMLFVATIFVAAKMELFAEQIANIVYFLFLIGTLCEIYNSKRKPVNKSKDN